MFATSELPHSSPPSGAYCNLPTMVGRSEPADPFDTSYVYAPPSHRYYSDVAEGESARYYNQTKPASEFGSAATSNGFEDNYGELFDDTKPPAESSMKQLDSKFIAELEKSLGVKEANANTSIPTLRPPPPASKSSLKKQPNFMSHQMPMLNAKVNTWSAKTTNIHAEQQRPMSVCLPNSFDLQNEVPTLSAAFSANDLVSPDLESRYSSDQRYSNDLLESESMLNRMWISDKGNVSSDSGNNLYRDTSNKCEKVPLHSELMTMMAKSRNVYDNLQNRYAEKMCNGDVYTNTSSALDYTVGSSCVNGNSNFVAGTSTACSRSSPYGLYEEAAASAAYDVRGSFSEYDSRYQNGYRDSVYGGSVYGNTPNIYDAVAEDIYQDSSAIPNIYDSVADEYNYCMTQDDVDHPRVTNIPPNSVSMLLEYLG